MTRIVGFHGHPVVDITSFPEWPGGDLGAGTPIHPAHLRELPPEKVTYARDDGPLHG